MAVASLVCSLLSLVTCALGFIPGIICGHLAKAEMRRQPSLKGRGLATWGLIVGYVSAGLALAVVVILLCLRASPESIAKLRARIA